MPQDPGPPEEEESREKKPASQGKSGGKKEASKRDGKEKKDRGGPRVRGLGSALSAGVTDGIKGLCRGCLGRSGRVAQRAGGVSLSKQRDPAPLLQFRFLPPLFSADSVYTAL